MIAILTIDTELALNVLKQEGSIKEYSLARRRGVFNSDREFMIATRCEQLEGLRVSDYRVIGQVTPDLIEVARTRMV